MKSGIIKWTSADSAGIGVCLALTVLAGWIGFYPIWQKHNTFLNNQRELQTKKEDNAQQEISLKAVEKKLALTQLQFARIPLHLQPTAQLNERLAAITTLAGSSNLKIEDIAPGATAKGKRYDTTNIHVEGEGTYPSSALFLHQLKTSMPDIGIQSLAIKSENAGAQAQAKFFFDLQWFAASGSPTAPADDSSLTTTAQLDSGQ